MSGLRVCLKNKVLTVNQNDEEQIFRECVDSNHMQRISIKDHNDEVIVTTENAPARELFEKYESFFDKFQTKIMSMKLKHSDSDQVFLWTKNLSLQLIQLFDESLDIWSNRSEVRTELSEYIKNHFKGCSTRLRRRQAKMLQTTHVEPEEKAIGLMWKSNPAPEGGITSHFLKEAKFSYVSIVKQLEALFSDEHFSEVYFEFNKLRARQNIECTSYSSYSTAENFRKSSFFEQNPLAIQIQLAVDDCELASALKTKTGLHKMCCIYMQIVNLPAKYLSKLDSIYLVALCPTANTKQKYTSLDNVLEPIVQDIRHLECIGFTTKCGVNLKATLVGIAYDNLGGNEIYGLPMGFNGNYICRHCDSTKDECQLSSLKPENSRTIEKYEKHMRTIAKSGTIDTKKTTGFHKYCILNDIQNFHILENNTVDLMHDFNEGIIQFMLRHLIDYIVSKNIISREKLTAKIRDFDYGYLNKKNRPSLLNTDKRNLNQNASQTYCLMTHIPYILIDYQEKLLEDGVWNSVQSLLQIMQIVYSRDIPESEVKRLESIVPQHLESVKSKFGVKIITKHHNALHYADAIRKMGAPKSMWMMRYEAKHKIFTTAAKNSNNFMNISKTLAERHQDWMQDPIDVYRDDIVPSKRNIAFDRTTHQYAEIILNSSLVVQLESLVYLKFAIINGSEYRKGLMIMLETGWGEILSVLKDDQELYIVYQPFLVMYYDAFCNSIVVKKDRENTAKLVKWSDLLNKDTHQKVISKQKIHISANTLDFNVYIHPFL